MSDQQKPIVEENHEIIKEFFTACLEKMREQVTPETQQYLDVAERLIPIMSESPTSLSVAFGMLTMLMAQIPTFAAMVFHMMEAARHNPDMIRSRARDLANNPPMGRMPKDVQ